MLIRGIILVAIIMFVSATTFPQTYARSNQYKAARLGLRLPNFMQYRTPAVEKRRIGLRLPNLIKFKDNGFDQHMEKRRMGMRLPNIIFLRNEKKNVLDY